MTFRLICSLLLTVSAGLAQSLPNLAPGLTVLVLQGDNVVHNLPDPPITHIAVRVTDGDGKPLPRAVAVFETPEFGASAVFPDGGHVKVLLTDSDGAATAEITSNGVPGSFTPKITVNYLGRTTTATLRQENALGAQIRPAAYSRVTPDRGRHHKARFSGLKKKVVIVGIAAVAVIGSSYALRRGGHTFSPGGITITPGSGTVGGK